MLNCASSGCFFVIFMVELIRDPLYAYIRHTEPGHICSPLSFSIPCLVGIIEKRKGSKDGKILGKGERLSILGVGLFEWKGTMDGSGTPRSSIIYPYKNGRIGGGKDEHINHTLWIV